MFLSRLARLTGALVLIGCMSACNYQDYHSKSLQDYGSRQRDDPKTARVRSFGNYSADPGRHENQYFEYSADLSRRVSGLPGIYTALVFVTDRNAYVGIMTDWSATGTKARGGRNLTEQDNSGTMEGVYDINSGSSKWDNRQLATPYNSYFTHKDVSDLSSELRQTIGDTIRRAHPTVQEVHVSGNREFVNQLVEFAKLSWAGRSLNEVTPQFNQLVRYMFGMGHEIPVPLYEHDGDSPGGVGPEPQAR
ncbi:hypothetical protein E5161_16720 [Cohnella pontilimi]|uniref:Uncharacterized protein n=1 Tax=Cohnella pontilimi TaxID=2564100 RepID=A0A4U0F7V7_9BACL|nr:hypothetical protein [Cohnella pontilimi]TJY40785.1 hypothetical protein E5161_16720 [Cohnella pontilimi]